MLFDEKLKRAQLLKVAKEHEEKMKLKREADRKELQRQKEKAAREEFKERCDKALMPIFEQVEKIYVDDNDNDKNLNSWIAPDPEDSDYSPTDFNDQTYVIELKWGCVDDCDHETSSPHLRRSIRIDVIRRRKKEPSIADHEYVLEGISTARLKHTGFLGLGEGMMVWDKKITLNDLNWKEKVQASILKQLGIE